MTNGSMVQMAQEAFKDWPLIEIYGVGPDGVTCQCPAGRNCKPGSRGKHPVGADWQHSERVDVEAMLRRRPRANLGTLTGRPAGFFVLDIDDRGLDTMAELRAKHGALPNTRVHKTGGGTFHYFFAMPDFDVTNRQGSVPKTLDIRGTGGQVVLPPSVSAKGEYSVVRDAPILPAPDWLLDMLRPTEDEEPVASEVAVQAFVAETEVDVEPTPFEQTPRQAKYEAAIVEGEISRLAAMGKAATPGGEGYAGDPWDWTTFMASCQLVELANADWTSLSVDEARDIVLEHAPRDDGFTTSHVKAKFESAVRKVGDKKRPEPVDNTSWMDGIPMAPPTAPAATPSQKDEPAPAQEAPDPSSFFDKDGVRAMDLAKQVIARGPIRWGQNARWWTWDERGVWVEDKEAVTNRVIDLTRNRFRTAHASNTEAVVKRFAEPLVIDEPDPAYMNFTNGMLRWREQRLEPHHPDMRSTVQFPHAYDPDATCPRFDAFLASVMSEDYQRLAWEMIGYLLYSGNPLQVAFLLHGAGGNGKGTLIKVVTAMLGAANLAHQSLDALNGDKFAAANLFGKIANIAGDIDATFQESTARFKMLTGEDRFSGEYKYGDSFGFNNFAVPLFSANKIPGSADVSKGYLRRWVNIEFDRTFAGDPIRGLGESLAATEIPGIIAKGLKYLPGLLSSGDFTIEGEALKGKETFANAIDQVRQWVEEETLPVPDSEHKQDDLYREYRFWAERNGTGKLKAADFYTRLEGIGYSRVKVRGVRSFRGIAIVQTAEQKADWSNPAPQRTLTDWLDDVDG